MTRADRAAGEWLLEAELQPTHLKDTASLAEAVELFQRDGDLRILPIVNRAGRPIGAVMERDVRRLLLNPFGHALLRNPTIGGVLDHHIRACPTRELTDDIATLLAAYHAADGREGMIITLDGRLHATISNRRLLTLASQEERRASERRLRRAEHIERASARFQAQASDLAGRMVGLADSVQQLAEATASQAGAAGEEATSVAGAAVQTRDSLSHLASRGQGLASAFGQIEQNVASNRRTASRSMTDVSDGATRARELLTAAQSVGQITNMVSGIAGAVKLLSLNATIEAARAGEAGRGFVVVAREIRKLAEDAKDATQFITAQILQLKKGIERVAHDYGDVEAAMGVIAAGSAEIDLAISSEADTTRLIATSVAEAGQASSTIEQAVSRIVSSVQSTSSSARQLDGTAASLRSGAFALGQTVESFLQEVRAA